MAIPMLADVTTSSRAMSLFNSRLGYPTAFQAPPRTHFHPYWTFTQPGVYCLAIQATGKLADGTWASGDGQITMVVGGAADGVPDPSTVVPCERNGQPLPVAAPNTSVHPVERFDDDVLDAANRIAQGPPHAFAIAKELFNQAAGMDRLDDHLDREIDELARAANGPEFAEGLRAFFEKRPPVFGAVERVASAAPAGGPKPGA